MDKINVWECAAKSKYTYKLKEISIDDIVNGIVNKNYRFSEDVNFANITTDYITKLIFSKARNMVLPNIKLDYSFEENVYYITDGFNIAISLVLYMYSIKPEDYLDLIKYNFDEFLNLLENLDTEKTKGVFVTNFLEDNQMDLTIGALNEKTLFIIKNKTFECYFSQSTVENSKERLKVANEIFNYFK